MLLAAAIVTVVPSSAILEVASVVAPLNFAIVFVVPPETLPLFNAYEAVTAYEALIELVIDTEDENVVKDEVCV